MGSSNSKFNLHCKLCIKTLRSVILATEKHVYSHRHSDSAIQFKFRACKTCLHCYRTSSHSLSKRKIFFLPLPQGESSDTSHPSCMLCPIRHERYIRNYYYFEGLALGSFCSNCLLKLSEMVPYPQKRVSY